MRILFFSLFILIGCQQKQPEKRTAETDTTTVKVTPQDAYDSPKEYDYREFFGTYDHESTTTGFSATLTILQNGNDLYFNVSVVQGGCKGKTEGVVLMVEHAQDYYTGFYESDDCRLQFTFNKLEKKVDIKEISMCRLLEGNCSFEGAYLKRID